MSVYSQNVFVFGFLVSVPFFFLVLLSVFAYSSSSAAAFATRQGLAVKVKPPRMTMGLSGKQRRASYWPSWWVIIQAKNIGWSWCTIELYVTKYEVLVYIRSVYVCSLCNKKRSTRYTNYMRILEHSRRRFLFHVVFWTLCVVWCMRSCARLGRMGRGWWEAIRTDARACGCAAELVLV